MAVSFCDIHVKMNLIKFQQWSHSFNSVRRKTQLTQSYINWNDYSKFYDRHCITLFLYFRSEESIKSIRVDFLFFIPFGFFSNGSAHYTISREFTTSRIRRNNLLGKNKRHINLFCFKFDVHPIVKRYSYDDDDGALMCLLLILLIGWLCFIAN